MRANRMIMDRLRQQWQSRLLLEAVLEGERLLEIERDMNNPFIMDVFYDESATAEHLVEPPLSRKEIIGAQLNRLSELTQSLLEKENYEEVARLRTVYDRLLGKYREL